MSYNGIGRVKYIQIKAVIELAKRISRTGFFKNNIKIKRPKDVYDLVYESYIGKKQEIIKTILVNKSNNVISVVTNSLGNVDSTSTSIKEIFSEPIKQMASGIILVHNHPSGNTQPSNQDIKFTKFIKENGEIFGIKVLDHIIVADNGYTSLCENGYVNM
ncbi:hypothetical protein D3C76_1183810 [compost metagenome]